MRTFAERTAARMDELGPLCAGIDPHPSLLEAWGLEDTPSGLRTFSLNMYSAITDLQMLP